MALNLINMQQREYRVLKDDTPKGIRLGKDTR